MGWGNPVAGGTVLTIPALQSPGFRTGVTGWQIRQDGGAEFNSITIRGTFSGTNFVINANGTFFYSGPPALGNLIASITPAAGTDALGNAYLAGDTSYQSGPTYFAEQSSQASILFYNAPGAAGPWTQVGSITCTGGASGMQLFSSPGGFTLGGGALISLAGTAASPTLITTDSWNAMTPLANGWANVAGFATARYRMTPLKGVEVIAAINAAAATSSTFFTLPAAYRPATQQPIGGAGASGSVPAGLAPWCRCDAGGNLTVQNTGAVGAAWQFFVHGFISLDA